MKATVKAFVKEPRNLIFEVGVDVIIIIITAGIAIAGDDSRGVVGGVRVSGVITARDAGGEDRRRRKPGELSTSAGGGGAAAAAVRNPGIDRKGPLSPPFSHKHNA